MHQTQPARTSLTACKAPSQRAWGALLAALAATVILGLAPGTCQAQADLPSFFDGTTSLGGGVYYLTFPNGNFFGYYSDLGNSYIYHFDLGYEYVFDAKDGKNGVYLYDFQSGDYFYTSPTFPFPYLYDFTLGPLYYYPDTNNPGRYTTNPRFFYDFEMGLIISFAPLMEYLP